MKFCGNCNREYDDNLNFCSKCGRTLMRKPQEYFCPSCGKSLGESFDRFCPYCGCQFEQVQVTINAGVPNTKNDDSNTESVVHSNKSYTSTVRQSSNRPGYFSKEYLFSFKGRRGRAEGFITWLVLSALMLGMIFLGAANQYNPFVYLLVIIGFLIAWAEIANAVKRAHDFNKSGLWLMGCCIGFMILGAVLKAVSQDLQAIFSFVVPYLLYLPKGTDGYNKYGL